MKNSENKILVVEDTTSVGMVMVGWLKKSGFNAELVGTGSEALDKIKSGGINLILLDLQLPDMDGLKILDIVNDDYPHISVVVVTASGSISVAIDAMRRGAYDFVIKPAGEDRMIVTTKNALERSRLQTVVKEIRGDFKKDGTHGFIGKSLPMIAVYKTIDAVALSQASVFITGESGTGKEVCANAIHTAGPRKSGPFIALNCAAIPKDLIESEIFGHVKGAFTGASAERDGAAIAASGGTLFLDEICEMDLSLQSKLLRFLQTGTVQKVGSDKLVKVDVRIICATNRDPLTEVEEGRFREDLYYRLHVIPIHLPPLRERETDVIAIAKSFLKQYCAEEGKSFDGFTQNAEDLLLQHSWPGNIRELQNVIRNAVILNQGSEISDEMLSLSARAPYSNHQNSKSKPQVQKSGDEIVINLHQDFAQIEREIIEAAISLSGGSIPKASEMLSLSPSTIYRKKENWQ